MNAFEHEAVLSCSHLTKEYSGITALDDVSLRFFKGEVHAIVGENGAGKSTLIKILSGHIKPTNGTLSVGGCEYTGFTPLSAKKLGIEAVHQQINLLPDMSVAENILMGHSHGHMLHIDFSAMNSTARSILSGLGVDIDPRKTVSELSTAQMRFVELAKAEVSGAKLLILDEPTAPLTSEDVKLLYRYIRALKERGVTVVYISHRMSEVFDLADRITVMRDGKLIRTCTAAETTCDEVIRMMVGRELSSQYPLHNTQSDEVVMSVKDLCGGRVKGASFELRRGEVLGIAGLTGSGRSQLARLLTGARKKESGTITVHGQARIFRSPVNAVRCGIAYLPEDREKESAMLDLSVRENTTLKVLDRISKAFRINRRAEKQIVDKNIIELNIKASSPEQAVRTLSGGNQQKVVLGKLIAAEPDIFVLDEPTSGIDVGARYELYQVMSKLLAKGKSIIMISSDMEELLGMSDRIIVLHEGKISGRIERRSIFDQELIVRMASGLGA